MLQRRTAVLKRCYKIETELARNGAVTFAGRENIEGAAYKRAAAMLSKDEGRTLTAKALRAYFNRHGGSPIGDRS